MMEIASSGHVGPVTSSLLVDGVGTVGFALLALSALLAALRKKREARAADASFDPNVNTTLALGETVIHGVVERAEGAATAVRVEVDQDGEESENSGVWSHKWTERDRRVHVEPFYLRLPKGDRVRVEPREDVFLVDEMDGLIRVDLKRRTRFAELTPGERVFASGVLSRGLDPEAAAGAGYRSAREGFVLRAPPGGQMLLSSEPLGDRFRERAAFHTRWMLWIVFVAFVFHAFFLAYHARRYFGEVTEATIARCEHYTTKDDDGDDVDHYRIWMDADDGAQISDHVNHETFQKLHPGFKVPLVRARGMFEGLSTIGPDHTVFGAAWVVVPVLLGVWFAYRARERTTRPWYERDVVDTGKGRLSETFDAEKARSERKPKKKRSA